MKRGIKSPMNPVRMERIIDSITGGTSAITENIEDYTFSVVIAGPRPGMDVFGVLKEIKKRKPSHQNFQIFVEQPKTSAVLRLGGTAASVSTLPVPEGAGEMKWLDKLRVGGTAAMLSVLPVPELT